VRQTGVSSNSEKVQAVLSELEEWEAILKAEPELIHKLREFEQAAKAEANTAPRRSGPKMRGPSL
jgi:predicted DNA-binding protein (MmcQ/YjbR family)